MQQTLHGLNHSHVGYADGYIIIARYRSGNTNLRTQFKRIIEKAGLKPRPKLVPNLRSTRVTELERQFPIHVVCAWLGNTRAVPREHDLQARDEDFEKAAQGIAAKAVQQPVEGRLSKPTKTTQALENQGLVQFAGTFCNFPQLN